MQNAALRACEIGMQYARFHIRTNELRSALLFLRTLDFVGINVTVPHKIAAFKQVDETDESAARAEAVNTIRVRDEKLIGSNTDGEGFLRAIRTEFSIDLRDLRVMIIGAGGGTGRAIAWQCALESCERLVLVNRTLEKANALAEQLRPFLSDARVLGPATRLEAVALDESAMRVQLADIDLIVNATPMGTAGVHFDRSTHLAAPRSRVAHRTTAIAGDLAEELSELKRERNAVILAHNYQVPELQDVADFVGDSLGLSYQAAKTDADVILFCGVHFMAETAKIINPTKRVILPDLDAGCSLSESCPPDKLAEFLKQHADKNYYVIAYINCSAGVEALADVICTSGNADKIVRSAPTERNILFVPDQNLGAWVMERTGRKMDLWQGTCYVHVEFTARSINKIREEYPDAPVVAHPECTYAVRMLADEVCSTEKMVTFCRESPADEIILVTEAGLLHRLRKEIPDKTFIPGPTDNCLCR